MSNTTAPHKTSAQVPARTRENSILIRMAERFQMDPKTFESVVRATLMPDQKDEPPTSNEHVAAFLLVAHSHGLNPFTRQIYAFPSKRGGIVPIVSIDGWLQIMNSHPEYDGIEYEDSADEQGRLISITAKLYRKDRSHPTCMTEYMRECKRNTEPWQQWPARMLRHKATIQAARAAFGLAGIYDPDEGERIRDTEVTAVRGPANGRGMAALADAVGAEATGADQVDEELLEADAAGREPGADEEIDA